MSQQLIEKPKTTLFAIFFGSLDILTWIKAKVEKKNCFLKNPKILQEFFIFENLKNPNT